MNNMKTVEVPATTREVVDFVTRDLRGDAWPAIVDVMYAPGLLYKPKPEDAQRFADLAESGYIGAVEGPHGGFAGYELRKRGWELIVRRMGYER